MNEKDFQDVVAMGAYNDLLLRFRHERTGSEGLHNWSYGSKFKVYKRHKAEVETRSIVVDIKEIKENKF